MHIVFITLVDPTGTSGQNLYSRAVATALAKRDETSVSLICPQPKNPLPPTLSEKTVSISYLPKKQSRSIAWHARLQKPMYDGILEINQERKIDGIVSPLKPSLLLPPVFSRLLDVPQVLLVEGMMSKNIAKMAPFPGASRVADLIANVNANQSSYVFTAYEEAKEWISSLPYVEESKIEVFHHGVDTELFSPMDKTTAREEIDVNCSDDEFVVGFVGSFKDYHCLETLVQAVAELRDNGLNISLLLVGEGPQRESVATSCREANIEESVTFTGFVDHEDVDTYICACDALYGVIDPEHWGSPMKVYEYLACGRPTIVYDSDELRFIEKRQLGTSVTSVTVPAVAEAIEDIYKLSEPDRVNMGTSAREYILNNQTWETLAERITAAL